MSTQKFSYQLRPGIVRILIKSEYDGIHNGCRRRVRTKTFLSLILSSFSQPFLMGHGVCFPSSSSIVRNNRNQIQVLASRERARRR